LVVHLAPWPVSFWPRVHVPLIALACRLASIIAVDPSVLGLGLTAWRAVHRVFRMSLAAILTVVAFARCCEGQSPLHSSRPVPPRVATRVCSLPPHSCRPIVPFVCIVSATLPTDCHCAALPDRAALCTVAPLAAVAVFVFVLPLCTALHRSTRPAVLSLPTRGPSFVSPLCDRWPCLQRRTAARVPCVCPTVPLQCR
jgi:hypothetical protein